MAFKGVYGLPEWQPSDTPTTDNNAFITHARSSGGGSTSFTQFIVLLGADFTTRLIWAAFGLIAVISAVMLAWNSVFFVKLIYYLLTTSVPKYSKESQGRLRSARRKIQNIRLRMTKEGVLRKRVALWLDGAVGTLTLSRFGNVRLVRRSVVMVGGDFARSPRMQYHATSLSSGDTSNGVSQEVVLVGYTCGNKLCEDIQVRSAISAAKAAYGGSSGTLKVDAHSGLIKPVEVPAFLAFILSPFGRKIGWIIGTVYRVGAQTLLLLSVLLPLITVTVRRVKMTQADHRSALEKEEKDIASSVSKLLSIRSGELKRLKKEQQSRKQKPTTTSSTTTTTVDDDQQQGTTTTSGKSIPAEEEDDSSSSDYTDSNDGIQELLDEPDGDDDQQLPPKMRNNKTSHKEIDEDHSSSEEEEEEEEEDFEEDDDCVEDETEEYERLARRMQEAAEAANNPNHVQLKKNNSSTVNNNKAAPSSSSSCKHTKTTSQIADEIARAEEEIQRRSTSQKNKIENESTVHIIELCVTSVILCQTPPAIPMLPLLQTLVRAWSPIITTFRTLPVRLMTIGTGLSTSSSNGLSADLENASVISHTDDDANEERQRPPTTDEEEESKKKSLSSNSSNNNNKKKKKMRPESLMYMIRAVNVRPQLIIDWHNLGFTLLELDNRPRWMVDLYRLAEKFYGRGDHLLTVSAAMKTEMSRITEEDGDTMKKRRQKKISVGTNSNKTACGFDFPASKITVLHDCAPAFFAPCSPQDFLTEVLPEFPPEDVPDWVRARITTSSSSADDKNACSRGRIVVSATSWTADDDYTMVLDALCTVYDDMLDRVTKYPNATPPARLWVVITGKGATKAVFDNQLQTVERYRQRFIDPITNNKESDSSNNKPAFITISTIYFQSFAKYAKMLGGSDVGLSLHASSSGYDLPMKAVDMFGAGIPVMALYYPAISELVRDGESGWLFENSMDLADILLDDVLGLPPMDLDDEEGEDEDGKNDGTATTIANKVDRATVAAISDKLGLDMTNPDIAGKVYWERSCTLLTRLHKYVEKHQSKKWAESWEELALPVMQRLTAIKTVDIVSDC